MNLERVRRSVCTSRVQAFFFFFRFLPFFVSAGSSATGSGL